MTCCETLPHDSHALRCELAAEVLRSSGGLRLQVSGSSMLPTVWPGDTLLIERVEGHAVSKGDLVLVARERRLMVHRVTGKMHTPEGLRILTRGDAMPQPDPAVPHGNVLGKVYLILRKGKRIAVSRTPRLGERAIAALASRSDIALRVIVGIRGMRWSC